jgi:hypothetical protein
VQNSLLLVMSECEASTWKTIRGYLPASLHAVSLWQDGFFLVSKIKSFKAFLIKHSASFRTVFLQTPIAG